MKISTSQYETRTSSNDWLWILILIPVLWVTVIGKYLFRFRALFPRHIAVPLKLRKQFEAWQRPVRVPEGKKFSFGS